MLIKTIFFIALFYFVSKILGMLFDPMFDNKKRKSTPINDNVNLKDKSSSGASSTHAPIGEYIDYEEIK
ncbi:MAG TPA: hypothetical protein PKA54_10070 [Chitinophagaceae bacterium]|nr:hypothetical protein [Chitinophagaceae bacterium]